MAAARSLPGIPGLVEKTSPAFRRGLVKLGDRLGIDPAHLAYVMRFETAGTWAPDQQSGLRLGAPFNARRGTGLIQFMPYTARVLGITTRALSQMTALQQLPWVERYFKKVGIKPRKGNLGDVYLAVFAPAGMRKGLGATVYKGEGVPSYEQNKALDTNRDFKISVAEAIAPVTSIQRGAIRREPIAVNMSGGGGRRRPNRKTGSEGVLGLSLLELAALGGVATAGYLAISVPRREPAFTKVERP